MQIKHNVQSSAQSIKPIDVNVDTVYLSYDIQPYEGEHEGIYWNIGTMIIMSHREYIEGLLTIEKAEMDNAVNTSELINTILAINYQQQLSQAETNAELINLIMAMGGM